MEENVKQGLCWTIEDERKLSLMVIDKNGHSFEDTTRPEIAPEYGRLQALKSQMNK